jgi:hypothetical protein
MGFPPHLGVAFYPTPKLTQASPAVTASQNSEIVALRLGFPINRPDNVQRCSCPGPGLARDPFVVSLEYTTAILRIGL